MPMILDTIDKISRDKQRDVLYITFHDAEADWEDVFDWEQDERRKRVISFLESHGISYRMCFPPQPTNGMVVISGRYKGEIYVDVEFDDANETYKLLNNYLEDECGKPRIHNVLFWYYKLELAMKNAKHDEPGYWDNM
ncbi:hypothetical protein [Ghiorsea bivora]|uniref:hypothetical protein n=1 Tax=Ghiorsea bivora TaxID=1485545 RepID=UPI0005713333|nr:hypothetical protein [Ghiorsea bivora]